MKEIVPGIFLGDAVAAQNLEALHKHGIRVICSILRDFEPDKRTKTDFICKIYPLVDDGTDNLLRIIEEFNTDIELFLSKGFRILVHCAQGVSRSVALVTGYLMKKQRMAFPETYSFMRKVYTPANIADNFRDQLIDYGDLLQWNVFSNSQTHRLYRAKTRIDIKSDDLVMELSNPKLRYLCRKCRQSLFLDNQIVPQSGPNYMVECMRWMNCDTPEGPIMCPKCQGKIGYYNWSGSPDNSFDGPVFIITKSKVDEMPLSSKHFGDSFPLTRF